MDTMLKEFVKLNTNEEVEAFLNRRRDTDKWVECPISKCSVVTIEDALEKGKLEDVTQGAIDECLAGTGLMFRYYDKKKRKFCLMPLRYTAMDTLLDRAGVGGRTFYNEEAKPDARVLPLKEKAAFMSKALKLYDGNCKILIRAALEDSEDRETEEMISATLSGQYAILPDYELEEELQNMLAREYPFAELTSGVATQEFLSLNWALKEDSIEEDLMDRLQECGVPVAEVVSYLKFITSDIGKANACCFPYFLVDGRMLRCGKPIEVKHMGKKTVEDFAKELPRINAMYKSDADKLQGLAETTIHYPGGCFRSVAYKVGLPKKLAMKVSEKLDDLFTCSAFDIYFTLHDVMEEYEKTNTDITSLLRVQEAIASSLYLDFAELDVPFEWKKGE